MSSSADQVIAALRSGHDHLVPIVRSLDENALTQPSVDTEWDLSQVISHLGSGAVISLGALDAALAGLPHPGMEFNRSVWARWDAMAPGERAASFPEANQALVERYEALDAEARDGLRVDLGFLPQPVDVATAAQFRLSEFALHSWDVRASLDPSVTVAPEAVAILLDSVADRLGWVGKAAALDDRPVALTVTVTDPDRTFGLSIADAVTLVDTPAAPDGALRLTAEEWLRLVSGRLRPEFTPAGVDVSGRVDLTALRRVFPGY